MEDEILENQVLSVDFNEVDFSVDKTFDSDKFIKMSISGLVHDGKNENPTSFDKKGMESAKSSIYNIPILGRVVFDKNNEPQFNGHDKHKERLIDNSTRVIYDEVPIGVVPYGAKYEVKKGQDGKWRVFTECYIWRGYSNFAEDIINRDKKIDISMEIIIDKVKKNDSGAYYDVLEYRYKGITFLGSGKKPAMVGANAAIEYEEKVMLTFSLMQELLEKELANFEKGGVDMGDELEVETKIEDVVIEEEHKEEETETKDFSQDEQTVEQTVEVEEDTKEVESEIETKEEEYECSEEYDTYRSVRRKLEEAIKPLCGSRDNHYQDYDLVDFDDTYIYCSKYYEDKVDGGWTHKRIYVKVQYMVENDVYSLVGTEVEVFPTLLTSEEMDQVNAQKTATLYELEQLREFKKATLEKDRVSKIQCVFSKFDESLDGDKEYEDLKVKSLEDYSEVDEKEVEKECYAIFGAKSFKSKPSSQQGVVPFEYETEEERDTKPKKGYELRLKRTNK